MEHSERALIGRGARSDGTRSVPTTINVYLSWTLELMRRCQSARLKTSPTGERKRLETAPTGGENVLKFPRIKLEDARYHILLLPFSSGMY